MLKASATPNSQTALLDEIYRLSDAGCSLVHLATREPYRAAFILRRGIIAGTSSPHYKEWDVVNGFRFFTNENFVNQETPGDQSKPANFINDLRSILDDVRNPQSALRLAAAGVNGPDPQYIVFMNAGPFIGQPVVIELLRHYRDILPQFGVTLVFITEVGIQFPIPPGMFAPAELSTPSSDELVDKIRATLDRQLTGQGLEDGDIDVSDDDARRLSYLGLGLSMSEFEEHLALGLRASLIAEPVVGQPCITYDSLSPYIAEGKTRVVRQSEMLELTHPTEMSQVGGMGRLKDWVQRRARCYSDEAAEFGIEYPKGVAVFGIPGVGKSLIAKAISSALGVPLVRFDFGSVFSKYVGDSESRMRQALKMVEDMAPVVLMADEIEKALGGSGGTTDSGVSSRILGIFLTWLQEHKSKVFVVATMNRVDGLPPELTRKGRFDELFFAGLPTADERIEVLDIHLRKRGREPFDLTDDERSRFLTASEGRVPAEIEAAVKEGLIHAFSEGTEIDITHVIAALNESVPMSKSNKEAIDSLAAWGQANAVNVSKPREETISRAPRIRTVRAPQRRH